VDARADDATALADSLKRQRHEITDSRKDDRGIERLRRHLVGSTRPGRTEASGEILGGNISRPREGKYGSTLPPRNLRQDMGRGAKPIEPQPLAFAGNHQRTPADQASAEQRSKRHVAADLAKWKCIARISDRRRREATVARVPGEEWMIAQIFLMRRAIGADAAGVTKPWNADTLARVQRRDAGSDRITRAPAPAVRSSGRPAAGPGPRFHRAEGALDACQALVGPTVWAASDCAAVRLVLKCLATLRRPNTAPSAWRSRQRRAAAVWLAASAPAGGPGLERPAYRTRLGRSAANISQCAKRSWRFPAGEGPAGVRQ
jgi:hypothetical protein